MISTVNRALRTSDLVTTTPLSGGQIIVVVLAGLLFGLALQLLLANFGIAIGLSVFNLKPKPQKSDEQSAENGDSDFGSIALIGVAAGLAIMLSIDGVLFAACFLAIKLSQVSDPWLGAILGGLVWSVYLILLTWLSTSAVGTVADTVLGYTRTGLRRLFKAVGQLFKTESSDPSGIDDDPDTIELSRQRLLQAVEDMDFSPVLESTLGRLNAENPSEATDLSQIVEQVISRSVGDHPIDWEAVVAKLQDRLHLPQPTVEQIQQQVREWDQELAAETPPPQPDRIADLEHFLQTAQPSELQPESLSPKLAPLETSQSSQPWSKLQQVDFKGLLRTALRRVDLSDWDVQRVGELLQSTQRKLTGSSQPEQPLSIIQLDVEDYLLNTPLWNLKSDIIDVDFKEVIYDPEADPALVHQHLTLLNPEQMRTLLQQREDMSPEQQAEISGALERVRSDVLEQVQSAPELPELDETYQFEQLNQVQQKLESYCRYTTLSRLSPEGIEQKLQTLMAENSIPASVLAEQMPDLEPLEEILKRRKGLKPKQRKGLLAAVTAAWQHLLPNPVQPVPTTPALQKRLKAIITEQVQGKNGEPITLEDLKPHFIQLMDQPTSGLTTLNQYLGQLDWMSLGQDLQQEYDLSPKYIDATLTQLRDEWQQVAKVPRRWARRTQRTAQNWQRQLQRYLKYQDRSALTGMESLEKDLHDLLDEANIGVTASDRLPRLPRPPKKSEIIALLQERKDLTTADIEKISSRLSSSWEQLVEEDQSLQKQAQSSLDTLATKVQEMLNSLPQAAPDPAQLQETLEDVLPHIELSQIGDRLQALARKAPTELLNESSWHQIRDRISDLTQSTYQQLIDTRDDLEDTVKHQLSQQAEALQNQILDQVDQLQTELQQQALEFTQETQRQADKVRQSAAIAAWWLFAIALTSGMTSALSGFLAVKGLQ